MRFLRSFARFAAIGVLAAVVILSLLPVPPQPVKFNGVDKLEHSLAYAALTFLLCLGFLPSGAKPLPGLGLAAAAFLLSAFIEIVQPFVGRTFDWFDMASNAFGVISGWLLYLVTRRTLRNRSA